MPIKGAKYRFKGKVRLAIKKGKVVEVRKFKGSKGHMKPAGPAKAIYGRKKGY